MLFNSTEYALFLPIVFVIYWILLRNKLFYQNILLLFASYFFYASWNYKFLLLLTFSTLLDYFTGIKINNALSLLNKKIWLFTSIVINLGFLAIFKYYNFFINSFSDGLLLLGLKSNFNTLQVILPLGISFYTFHGLSYVIDIYNNKIPPERNFINYSLFVSFFPLLIAGPIERATHLLPQIINKREFDYKKSVEGLKQILWGLFKKVVIADNCAEYANFVFNNSTHLYGSTLLLGALFFAFQIYCDFSGYSDIAIGSAKLFGIELLRNFAFPYFSRNIAEFWRRWHISLSSWFRDYLYIPLGGSRGGIWMKIRNTLIIFLVSGFWHGANWTFIIWGLLNAIYIMPSIILNTNRTYIEVVAKEKCCPTFSEFCSICFTFILSIFAWIFFRSSNIKNALLYISGIFSRSIFKLPQININRIFILTILFIIIFIIIEWVGREQQYALSNISLKWPKTLRYTFYYSIILSILIFNQTNHQFIYFQF